MCQRTVRERYCSESPACWMAVTCACLLVCLAWVEGVIPFIFNMLTSCEQQVLRSRELSGGAKFVFCSGSWRMCCSKQNEPILPGKSACQATGLFLLSAESAGMCFVVLMQRVWTTNRHTEYSLISLLSAIACRITVCRLLATTADAAAPYLTDEASELNAGAAATCAKPEAWTPV